MSSSSASRPCSADGRAKHRVITSSHPSNLSRAQGAEPFDESRCFSRANELLSELDRGGIDWSLE